LRESGLQLRNGAKKIAATERGDEEQQRDVTSERRLQTQPIVANVVQFADQHRVLPHAAQLAHDADVFVAQQVGLWQ